MTDKIIYLSPEEYANLVTESYEQGWEHAVLFLKESHPNIEKMKNQIILKFKRKDEDHE